MAPTGVNTINFIFDLRGPALACHLWLALVSLVLHYLQVDADPQILSYSFKQKNISLTRQCNATQTKVAYVVCPPVEAPFQNQNTFAAVLVLFVCLLHPFTQ